MWNEGWTHEMMGGSYGGWHWLFSFHGFLSIVFVAVIVFAVVALIRDLRRRDEDLAHRTVSGTGHPQGEIDYEEFVEPKRHLKA